ncbi:unannotated protein [freshwater metagenome]|uniref:Unannotated protein n=1 Tax=freshwater metagenome TaxID=449393 RepID=A0A6J6ETD6_9ZZZZ
MAPILSITYWGESDPSTGWSYPSGYSVLNLLRFAHHASKLPVRPALCSSFNAAINSIIVSLASPTIGT